MLNGLEVEKKYRYICNRSTYICTNGRKTVTEMVGEIIFCLPFSDTMSCFIGSP